MPVGLDEWSMTPASNDFAVPDGAPEGWEGPQVNNVLRELMSRIRDFYDDPQWLILTQGNAVTRDSDSTVAIAGFDASAYYAEGRRIRLQRSGGGTVKGFVVSVVFATNTTVTVSLDNAAVVPADTNEIEGFISDADGVQGYAFVSELEAYNRSRSFD